MAADAPAQSRGGADVVVDEASSSYQQEDERSGDSKVRSSMGPSCERASATLQWRKGCALALVGSRHQSVVVLPTCVVHARDGPAVVRQDSGGCEILTARLHARR